MYKRIFYFLLALLCQAAFALNIPSTPLFLTSSAPPLNMLVMGKDHRLFYEAYNDATDLDGDGIIDVGFKPALSYYGYFDSTKCYLYDSGNGYFYPYSIASAGKCGSNVQQVVSNTAPQTDSVSFTLTCGSKSSGARTCSVSGSGTVASPTVSARSCTTPSGSSSGGTYTCSTSGGTWSPAPDPSSVTCNFSGSSGSGSCSGTYSYTHSVTTTATTSTWSGNFLNYLTMSRMDVVRKVLYGGYRSTDTGSETVLERAVVKNDAHTWGKEYDSTSKDGFNIADYSPLSAPVSGKRHLFASTTSDTSNYQVLRVVTDSSYRVWDWVSREVTEGQTTIGITSSSSVSPSDYRTRVKVCVSGLEETNCKAYTDSSSGTVTKKPIGLLQSYGTKDNGMQFGLLSGSYKHNMEGGVLRRAIGSINDEIDINTGRLISSYKGIIYTLNNFMYHKESGNQCGWITTRIPNDGECSDWGNPIGEMMYEAMRYFSGANTATAAYVSGIADSSDPATNNTATLNLPLKSWSNPFSSSNWCSKPFVTLLSDPASSYDSNLPGSSFSGDSNADNTFGSSFNVSTLSDTLWGREFGTSTLQVIMGEAPGNTDGAPTVKSASSFKNIRGIPPGDTTKQGTYNAAAVAYFGRTHDVSPVTGDQFVRTYGVAFGSPLPRATVNGVVITPFAKSVKGSSINPAKGNYQPTNQIVDYYVMCFKSSSTATAEGKDCPGTFPGFPYYRFRVSFEDVEQGADHDMDSVGEYQIYLKDGKAEVVVTSAYAAGGIVQHMGFTVSGSTKDGAYLVTRDSDTTTNANDQLYWMDAVPDTSLDNAPKAAGSTYLGFGPVTFRFSAAGSSGAVTALKDPIWYAAKWGSFTADDTKGAAYLQGLDLNLAANKAGWDADNDGTPDNYFLASSPLKLEDQLGKAFDSIFRQPGAAAAVATNSSSLLTDTKVYFASFSSADWSGELAAHTLDSSSLSFSSDPVWSATKQVGGITGYTLATRKMFTRSDSNLGAPFVWGSLSGSQQGALNGVSTLLDYLRGSPSNESAAGYRVRATSKLGDFVNSSPIYVGPPSSTYSDASYTTFKSTYSGRSPLVLLGGNDGMVHGFNADSGSEIFAYVPSQVFSKLKDLSSTTYNVAGNHEYFVDGGSVSQDVNLTRPVGATCSSSTGTAAGWRTVAVTNLGYGGRGVVSLDITNPSALSENSASGQQLLMWEFNATDDSGLGYTMGAPVIAKMNNGKWMAIVSSGFGNNDGHAKLFLLDLNKISDCAWTLNSNYWVIDTLAGDSSVPNGLGSPTILDVDGNGTADIVYAGDLFGNIWKFDVRSAAPSKWKVAFSSAGSPAPLFVAKDSTGVRQPVVTRIATALHPVNFTAGTETVDGETLPAANVGMVYFGTGKYLETCDNPGEVAGVMKYFCSTDVANATRQTFYGIWDNAQQVTGRSQLLEQAMGCDQTLLDAYNAKASTSYTCSELPDFRMLSNNAISWYDSASGSGQLGWFEDFPTETPGERHVGTPTVVGGTVAYASLIPDVQQCSFGGSGFLMIADMANGGMSRGRVTPTTSGGVTLSGLAAAGQRIGATANGVTVVTSGGSKAVAIYQTTSGKKGATQFNTNAASLSRVTWREMLQ